MAPVNQNRKDKGNLSKDGGKDKQINKRPGGVDKQHRTWVDRSGGEGRGFAFKNQGKFARNGGKNNHPNRPGGVQQKRKWVPEHKVFEGSIGEGQGFAFKRKHKVQYEYNKLLRKERKKNAVVKTQFREEYPDHLSHLYKAEAQKLNTEARNSRIKRTQCRMGIVVEEVIEDTAASDAPAEQASSTDAVSEPGVSADQPDPASQSQTADSGVSTATTDPAPRQPGGPPVVSDAYGLPLSNRQKKKMNKKSSFQKIQEEFENAKEKRAKKKEEFLKDKQQREEALQKYKQKKKEAFKVLNTKTKKGQPNLNVQMDYLLQKIQGTIK